MKRRNEGRMYTEGKKRMRKPLEVWRIKVLQFANSLKSG